MKTGNEWKSEDRGMEFGGAPHTTQFTVMRRKNKKENAGPGSITITFCHECKKIDTLGKAP